MPPRLPETVILRRDLLARLDDGISKKLILVTAPTGFGKTTLVAQWVESLKLKDESSGVPGPDLQPSNLQPATAFAWVTLDAHEYDPVRFWMYAITALRTLDASLGKVVLPFYTRQSPFAGL
jgi:LuxR family maltose regulon positive regulatory protein